MKIVVLLVRWFVGLLFIFSGLVKANDPLGLSYKMQEFFEVWGWHGLDGYTLSASVALNSVEIIAGVALLTGFAFRYMGWLLLLLILLFTGLTGYTFFTGMPKNCGCFGDCLPISAGFSFGKDILLTLLIALLLFFYKTSDRSSFTLKKCIPVILAAFFSVGLQGYALRYLPPVDCLPYKEGASIPAGLKMPANAIADSFIIEFTYRKNGKEVRFPATDFPADFSSEYVFVKRDDRLIRKGRNNEPPIKGFALQGLSGVDSTQAILDTDRSIWIWASTVTSFDNIKDDLIALTQKARAQGLPVFFITAQTSEASTQLSRAGLTDVPVYSCDLKAIQTAARVDPTVMLVKKGTILAKRSLPCWNSVIE
jgi:uncharacterized membrane protein YphA (DoxX/SURF4 family)